MFGRKKRIHGKAHVKRSTEGTSNELSFSVLDAAKEALDEEEKNSGTKSEKSIGKITLFSLGKYKKPIATPAKPKGIHLSTGEFISSEKAEIPSGVSLRSEGLKDKSESLRDIQSDVNENIQKTSSDDVEADSSNESLLTEALLPDESFTSEQSPSTGSWESPRDEIERRKAQRRKGKFIVAGVGIVAAIILISVLSITITNYFHNQQLLRNELVALLSEIDETDPTLIDLDNLVVKCVDGDGTQINTEAKKQELDLLVPRLDLIRDSLSSTYESLETYCETTQDGHDVDIANEALKAISARLSMIDAGITIVSTSIEEQEAINEAQQAMMLVSDADTKIREAAQLASNTTIENATASMALSQQAIEVMEQAIPHFEALNELYPRVDVSAYIPYLAKRIEAQNFAIVSDQAYLARDRSTAAEQNDAYNFADNESVLLAANLPEDPAILIRNDAQAIIDEALDVYSQQRQQAGEADTFIREYLGEQQ